MLVRFSLIATLTTKFSVLLFILLATTEVLNYYFKIKIKTKLYPLHWLSFPICAGKGSPVLDGQQFSGTKSKLSKTDTLKWKTKSSAVEEHAQELNTVSEVSEIQSTKRRVKQVKVASNDKEVKTTLLATSHKLSIKIDEVSGASFF